MTIVKIGIYCIRSFRLKSKCCLTYRGMNDVTFIVKKKINPLLHLHEVTRFSAINVVEIFKIILIERI